MDEGDEVFFVSLHYKGSAYDVPVQAEDSIASIFDFVQEALDFPRENCKLIFRGKMLRPDHEGMSVREARLVANCKLMLMATSAHDVSFVQSSRPDPLVKGFVEEERDERNRQKRARAAAASAWGTKQDAEYRFASMKAEFKYSEPPPYEAERLLGKLATDPGIIDVMKTHQFKVGILTEMSPVEAQERMAKRGTPNMDLLGFNQNAGEMIVLRLRTDNLKGFRPYHDLINTLLHELTHNVWGPHDHNFWKLYGELKAQYMRFHRFWSHGGHAADSSSTEQFQGFMGADGEVQEPPNGSFGQVLGTGAGDAGGSATMRAAAAAEARAAAASMAGATTAFAPSEGGFADLPNFLAGHSTWTLVCPCGQAHTFEGMCDAGKAVASSTGGPDTPDAAMPMDSPADTADGKDMGGGEPALLEAVVTQQPTAPVKEPDGTAEEEDKRVVSAAPGSQGNAFPSLDLSELAEHGLDGAALWLQRFQDQLRVFQGRPEARDAVAMLLRLVRNVVESPHEQKFRRIRADNPRIRASLLGVGEEAESLMSLLGFEVVTESGERIFLLRDAVFDYGRLRMGQEILERELTVGATSVP